VNPFVVVSATPTCPPPMPPAPLLPPAFALTGTGPVVAISALPDDLPFDLAEQEPAVTLRVVPPARSRAAKAPFIALVLGLLGGGLVTLLLINTALSQGAFAVQQLQKTNINLTEQQQQLNKDLADADQPQALASKAVALGMVPGGAPAFLRLPDGKVLGSPKVAVPLPKPTPSVTVTPPVAPVVTPGSTTTPGTAPSPGAVTAAPVTSAPVTSAAVTSAAGSPPPAVATTPVTTTPAGQGESTTTGQQPPPTKGKP
jgi:hypothetical protein